MSESASKRRRLNDSEPAPTSTDNPVEPITPTRASYRSPTKSSLSRSHPHLVPKPSSRPSTESRGKSLRDEILSRKKDPQVVLQSNVPAKINGDTAEHGVLEDKDSAEQTPVDTLSAAEASHDVSVVPSLSTTREQQFTEQPRARTKTPSLPQPNPQIITPTLVRKPTARSPSRPRSSEPELPPTPVQLGLTIAPDKPRGLPSSSSPRGSKMGSGKRRRRMRSEGQITSSPLKQKPRSPNVTEEPVEALESEQNPLDDLPASEGSRQDDQDHETVEEMSPASQEKRALLRSLRSELQSLDEEVVQLEATFEKASTADKEDRSLTQLMSLVRNSDLIRPQIENLARLDETTLLDHLTLFAPGGLQIAVSTEPQVIDHRPKLMQHLRVNPPHPWPEHVFHFDFFITVDVQEKKIEKIEQKQSSRRAGVYHWIQGRLANDLHFFDIAGLIWGMGQWFSAAVLRSKTFRKLDYQYNKDQKSFLKNSKDNARESLDEKEAIQLSSYLHTTRLALDVEEGDSEKKVRKILLVWDINIDWHGCPTSTIDIAVRGVSQKAQQGLKTVFSSILPTTGCVAAIAQVLEMLQSGEDDLDPINTPKPRGRPKGRKRKRVG